MPFRFSFLKYLLVIIVLVAGSENLSAAPSLDLFCKNHSSRYLTDYGTRVVEKETATAVFPSRFTLSGNVLTHKYPADQTGSSGMKYRYIVLSDDAKHFGVRDGSSHKVIVAATKGPEYSTLTATRLTISTWHITTFYPAIISGRPVTMTAWYKCDALADRM